MKKTYRKSRKTMLFGMQACVAMKKCVAVLLIGFVCAAQPAVALTTFNNEVDFLSVAGPLSFEGFEGLTANNSASLTSITASDFVVTASNNKLGVFDAFFAGQVATEGAQFLGHQSGMDVTTTFTFDSGINSFGFDLLDYGDFGVGQLTLVNNAGDNVVVAISGGIDGNIQYFGLISDFIFTEAIFTNTIPGEAFGFDKVSYRIPEPATICLLGLGGLLLRRSKRS